MVIALGLAAAILVLEPSARPWLGGAVAAAAIVLVLVVLVAVVPRRLIRRSLAGSRTRLVRPEDRLKAENEENDLRTLLLQAVSAVALVAGVVFTFLPVTATQKSAEQPRD
jgi:hypothetical protein